MKRSHQVKVTILPLLVAFLTGCGDSEGEEISAEYSEVCVEDVTDLRVDDANCVSETTRHHWMWFPYGYHVPSVGSKVNKSAGITSKPTGTIVRPPASGGFGTFRVPSGS